MEYAMLDRLQEYLTKVNVLVENQHGFRPKKSTTTAINEVIEFIVRSLDNGECPIGVYCDLSKAFDCVNHNMLIDKLNAIGIRGGVSSWFTSYLTDRKQFVQISSSIDNKINVCQSNLETLNMGVPQGTILGPVLFIIYINDLVDCMRGNPSALPVIYADDITLLFSNKNEQKLESECNQALENLNSWFNDNLLYLNAQKTNCMRLHARQKTNVNELNIVINNTKLCSNEDIKFLGIHLQKTMTWEIHCTKLSKKLTTICYQIRNLKWVISMGALITFYNANVYSRIAYGICFWGTSPSIKKVFLIQKRIIRTIDGAYYNATCRVLFRKYKLMTIVGIYIYETCKRIYINKHKFATHKMVHDYYTRNNDRLVVPFFKLNLGKNSPDAMGLHIFNHVPNSIKQANTVKKFKVKLKELLVEICPYTIDEFLHWI